jgi:integrative and conjugative element protein (TIGR02256 family)
VLKQNMREFMRQRIGTPTGTLTVGDEALANMMRFQQNRPADKEAGGQLFARFIGPDVHIIEATVPSLLDSRGRFSFRPNRLLQRKQIAERYARGLHFVGDWHTHPEVHPAPSSEDIVSMQDCFRRSTHDLGAFIMFILGTAQPPEGCYMGMLNGACVRSLSAAGATPLRID